MYQYHHSLANTISHPPMNSPFTYSWGIVGHSLSAEEGLWGCFSRLQSNSREFLDPTSQLIVSKDIIRLQFFGRYAMQAQNLYSSSWESTLWKLRCALHEKHNRAWLDSILDLWARFLSKKTSSDETAGSERFCGGGSKRDYLEVQKVSWCWIISLLLQ